MKLPETYPVVIIRNFPNTFNEWKQRVADQPGVKTKEKEIERRLQVINYFLECAPSNDKQKKALDKIHDHLLEEKSYWESGVATIVEKEQKKTKPPIKVNWQELLKNKSFIIILEDMEKKARERVFKKWTDIECAAFCHKLGKSGYLKNDQKKTMIAFALSKYEVDVTNSINKTDRISQKEKKLKDIFGT